MYHVVGNPHRMLSSLRIPTQPRRHIVPDARHSSVAVLSSWKRWLSNPQRVRTATLATPNLLASCTLLPTGLPDVQHAPQRQRAQELCLGCVSGGVGSAVAAVVVVVGHTWCVVLVMCVPV